MSYPKKIAKIRPTKGIANDVPAFEVGPDYWTQGTNVTFRNSFAERSTGYASVYAPPLTTLRALHNVTSGGINYWVYHGTNKSSVVTVATHTDITLAAGLTTVAASNKITCGLLNGIPFFTNGTDAPQYWGLNPANKFLVLPGWTVGTVCQAMRAYRNYLVAMNISTAGGDFKNQVLWSQSAAAGAVPAAWTAAATNDAGDTILAETTGDLVDGFPLRSSFVLYKDHSAYLMDYVGGNSVHSFRPLFTTVGALAKNCIAEIAGQHFVVTDGDIVMHDGNTATSIADKRMRSFLFNQIDNTNFGATFVVRFKKQNEVWVCFPSAGSSFADTALIWNSQNDAWGAMTLPLVSCANTGVINDTAPAEDWDSDSQVWDNDGSLWNQQSYNAASESLLFGKPNDASPTSSKFYNVDAANQFDGVNIGANVGKYGMSFDEPDRLKFVKRVYPKIDATAGVQVYCRVGSAMTEKGAISWSNEVTFNVGTDQYIDTFAQGKLLSFEFRSDGLLPWKLTGFDVEAEIRGYH